MTLSQREIDLLNIQRFHKFPLMYDRSNLLLHSRRVSKLIFVFSDKIVQINPNIDVKKAQIMGLIHDDPEIETGDIPAYLKEKFDNSQQSNLIDSETSAIKRLISKYGIENLNSLVNPYNYEKLSLEILTGKTLESKIWKYFDWFDAFGEIINEIFYRNFYFEQGLAYPNGNRDIPVNYYIPKLQSGSLGFENELAEVSDIFAEILNIKHDISKRNIIQHPRNVLLTEVPQTYELWRNVTKKIKF